MAFLEVPTEIAPSRNQPCFGKRQWCSFKSLRDLSFRSAAGRARNLLLNEAGRKQIPRR